MVCYRLHYKLCNERYGSSSGKSQVPQLKDYIADQNARFREIASRLATEPKDERNSVYFSNTKVNDSNTPGSSSALDCVAKQEEAVPCDSDNFSNASAQEQLSYLTMDVTSENQVVVAVCTPMMRRVHKRQKQLSCLFAFDSQLCGGVTFRRAHHHK